MIENELSLLIGGEAGQGIESAGQILGLNFSRAGLQVFAMNEFASQIRGGHNFHKVRVADSDKDEIFGHRDHLNVLVALNKESIEKHLSEVVPGGIVIYDNADEQIGERDDVVFAKVPLREIAVTVGGNAVMENTVALGFVLGLLDFGLDILNGILEERFSKKGAEVIEKNQACAKAGFDLAREKFADKFPVKFKREEKKQMFLNGNDAICLGALRAGMKLVAEYPMTPSSSILHIMATYANDYGLIVKHTEDEIAAVNMLTGAAYAGVRCMTGTSGGGFALMTEGCGVAGVAELPIVIVNVQRPGPSTGLPTRTEQGDLRQVMHAGQGDYPRFVVAPGDLAECFYETFRAFNLADKYQLPAFILSDKYLGEAAKTSPVFDVKDLKIDRGKLVSEVSDDFKRFEFTEDGVSPRVLPGTKNGMHLASSYEHDEYGFHTEDPVERTKMMDKRMKKMEGLLRELDPPELIGPKDAEITLVTWGSSKEACLGALPLLEDRANILQIKYMVPFHKKEVFEILSKAKKIVNVEMNYGGQLAGLIMQETGIPVDGFILNCSGRPFTGWQVAQIVKKLL